MDEGLHAHGRLRFCRRARHSVRGSRDRHGGGAQARRQDPGLAAAERGHAAEERGEVARAGRGPGRGAEEAAREVLPLVERFDTVNSVFFSGND